LDLRGEKVVEVQRRLHNEDLHNLYASPNIIRAIQIKEDEMGKPCSTDTEPRTQHFDLTTWREETTWETKPR